MRATNQRFLPTRVTFRSVLASDGSYWLQPVLVLTVSWWPAPVIPHPHLLVPGHQQMVSTSTGCNQWLPSLAKTLLKVALAGGNRSLVAHTSKCGLAIIPCFTISIEQDKRN